MRSIPLARTGHNIEARRWRGAKDGIERRCICRIGGRGYDPKIRCCACGVSNLNQRIRLQRFQLSKIARPMWVAGMDRYNRLAGAPGSYALVVPSASVRLSGISMAPSGVAPTARIGLMMPSDGIVSIRGAAAWLKASSFLCMSCWGLDGGATCVAAGENGRELTECARATTTAPSTTIHPSAHHFFI